MHPGFFWGPAPQLTATCWSSILSHQAALPAGGLQPVWPSAIFVSAHSKSSTCSAVGTEPRSVSLCQLRMSSLVQRTTVEYRQAR